MKYTEDKVNIIAYQPYNKGDSCIIAYMDKGINKELS